MDRLIVMDAVSGIADSCKEFANFLTARRKYRYDCVYVFHIIIPEKEIWKKIISQTNISNIFPRSVPFNTISKIFKSNCVLTTTKYVPVCSMWLTRVFLDLASQDERNCLTIACTNVNPSGPGWYRTKAENPEKQVCYFKETHSDQVYSILISKQIKVGNFEKKTKNSTIDSVQSKIDRETFNAKKTVYKNGSSNNRLSKRERETEDSTDGEGEVRHGKTYRNFLHSRESARPKFLSG